MSFNTAIFYDVENLVKGYSFSQRMIANLSLKELISAIKNTGRIGDIAVQRAYANWSDPRMAVMRNDINEMGIDPVQVFGFSVDQKKNAADIQLAIDAIDMAHIRPKIDVYVIVSGDGGFASLAKKLHEYGKTVIGCAYRGSTNKNFRLVCDDFVWLTDPDEIEDDVPSPGRASTRTQDNALRNDFLNKMKKQTVANQDEMLIIIKDILNAYAKNAATYQEMKSKGVLLSVIQEGISLVLTNFHYLQFGFAKFSNFLQFACADTPYCVARFQDNQPVLALREFITDPAAILPDLPGQKLHSYSCYLSILSSGSPLLRLPSSNELLDVAEWVIKNQPAEINFGTVVENATTALQDTVESQEVKYALLALAAADILLRRPANLSITEQTLTLNENIFDLSSLLTTLRSAVTKKLCDIIKEEPHQEIIEMLVPLYENESEFEDDGYLPVID